MAEARNNFLIRQALHQWRSLAASRRDLSQRVATTANNRRLKAALQIWHARLRERKQLRWRQDMRARMKAVRDSHDRQLVKGTYAQWRRAFRSRLAEQHYYRTLAVKIYRRWRAKLVETDQLENKGDQLVALREKRLVAGCCDLWRKELGLRRAETSMTESVALRVLAAAFNTWRGRL